MAQEPGGPQPVTGLDADEPGHYSDDDSALGETSGSETTSLMSCVMKYRREHGRTYHAYKDGVYKLPNDSTENERLDLQHHIYAITFGGKLHLAPIDKKKKPLQRVLDVGTGTGIWAIDFADEHPECQVTGVDLSPIQPDFVPPNVNFYVDDVEDPWDFSDKFDFIYMRNMTGSISDWPRLMEQAYEALIPGGYIELADFVFRLCCDDNTLPDDSSLLRWVNMVTDKMNELNRSLESALKYHEQLEDAGYKDITHQEFKWPSNKWPKDAKYKELGMWNCENINSGMSAFTLAITTRPMEQGGLGWSVQEMEVFLTKVRKELRDTRIHAYWKMHVLTAKKPDHNE